MTTITAPTVNGQCNPAERITRSLLGYGIIAGPMYILISLAQAVTRAGGGHQRAAADAAGGCQALVGDTSSRARHMSAHRRLAPLWVWESSCLNPLSLGRWPKVSPEADNQHPKPLPEPDEASQTLGKQPAHP